VELRRRAALDRDVTNERKIWEAAMMLVSRHGERAVDVAERETARYHRAHDEMTTTVWCWISRATAELLKPEPDYDEQIH
jgi:hypothetical protein